MKMTLLAIIVLASAVYAQTQEANKAPPLTVDELNQREVIGRLGLPLGTAAEIQAEIVAGSTTRRKAYASKYLLKVTHVNQKKLENPPLLTFTVPGFVDVNLANHHLALYELKTGKRRGMNSAQIEKLEQGYVGRTVKLLVYEEGRFYGIPRNLPDDVGGWAGPGFHFSTSLQVLADRENVKE